MADGYLEKHHEDYEARKEAWIRKQKHLPKANAKNQLERPDDEAL